MCIRCIRGAEVRVRRGAGTWMTAAELCAFIDTLDAAASRNVGSRVGLARRRGRGELGFAAAWAHSVAQR
jgi:hypothetical protein